MRKKLQVFISSTFTDLKEERQIAVKSILNAGHIPAGMELFTASDDSQLDIIKRWIEESDAYMLIIGGRYGSLLKDKSKSFTHWEYDYAGEIKKPRFVFVLSDSFIQNKVNSLGYKDALEHDNQQMHKEFREDILSSKLIALVDDNKDIQISIFKSLREIEQKNLSGWVSGKDVPDVKGLMEENERLLSENAKIKAENDKIKESQGSNEKRLPKQMYTGFTFDQLRVALSNYKTGQHSIYPSDLYELFIKQYDKYLHGVSLSSSRNQDTVLDMLIKSASEYIIYGLIEKKDGLYIITELGKKFIAEYKHRITVRTR